MVKPSRIAAIFARHVEAQGQGKLAKGTADFPVDEKGLKEAEAESTRVADLRPTSVHSSPLQRALLPAVLTAQKAGVPLKVDENLKPWEFGEWTGRKADEIEPKLRELYRTQPERPTPGGDSLGDFARQSKRGVLQALRVGGERPAIFTHSRNLRELPFALYGTALRDPTVGGPEPGEFDVLTTAGKLVRARSDGR